MRASISEYTHGMVDVDTVVFFIYTLYTDERYCQRLLPPLHVEVHSDIEWRNGSIP